MKYIDGSKMKVRKQEQISKKRQFASDKLNEVQIINEWEKWYDEHLYWLKKEEKLGKQITALKCIVIIAIAILSYIAYTL